MHHHFASTFPAVHIVVIIIVQMLCHILAAQHLPSPPAHIIQFELADAAVPNKETHQIIQQGRARSLQHEQQQHSAVQAGTVTTTTRPTIATQTPPQSARTTTKKPRLQLPPSYRRGRTSSAIRPVDDMLTDESRTVQIRMPTHSGTKGWKMEATSGKKLKAINKLPMEVRQNHVC